MAEEKVRKGKFQPRPETTACSIAHRLVSH